jgi:hypothetical protein
MLKRTLRRKAADLLTSPTGRFVALALDVVVMSAAHLSGRARERFVQALEEDR